MTVQRSAVSPLGWLLIVSACANTITAACVAYLVVTTSIRPVPVRGTVYVDGTVLVEGTRYGMPVTVKISQDPTEKVRVSIER